MWGMMVPYVTDAGEGYQSLQTQEKISSRYRRSGRRSFHPDEDQATQRQGFFHDGSGRPLALTIGEKKILVDTVRKGFCSRRMRIVDLQQEAGLGHVCRTTIFKALHENGLKAYREDFKFILSTDNKEIRQVR